MVVSSIHLAGGISFIVQLCNKPKWKLWQTVHFGAQKKLTQQTVASNGSFSYNPNTLLFHSCILIFS